MLNSLKALSCFTHITDISVIMGGLSNPCFKVEADGSVYFAKKTAKPLFATELSIAKLSAQLNISPAIFYHDDMWIISPFIQGDNLAQSQIPQKDKLKLSITLMADFHQLTAKLAKHELISLIPTLSIVKNVTALLTSGDCPAIQNDIVLLANQLNNLILPKINTSEATIVCCHSDVNFSNVLMDGKQKPWLIDFEYACYAPIEFDIAMLVAVNNIPLSSLSKVISLYENKTNITLCQSLCRYFLVFSYLINGLWYYSRHCNENKENTTDLLPLAQQQWKLYDQLTSDLALPTAKISLSTFI